MIQTAIEFTGRLKELRSDEEHRKISRYFKGDDSENRVIGVRMKNVFDLAKEYESMPIGEVEKLLHEPYYESRMGAVSILDFKVRKKNITEAEYERIHQLHLGNHHRINNWDFVDRAAPRVVGGYLYRYGKPREILYKLAESDDPWERRTAIVSTAWFLKNGETDDTYKIAGLLLNDEHEFVQKAVGTWVRHAGKQDEKRLLEFLEKHASEIRPSTLTIMMEKLEKKQKEHFRRKVQKKWIRSFP